MTKVFAVLLAASALIAPAAVQAQAHVVRGVDAGVLGGFVDEDKAGFAFGLKADAPGTELSARESAILDAAGSLDQSADVAPGTAGFRYTLATPFARGDAQTGFADAQPVEGQSVTPLSNLIPAPQIAVLDAVEPGITAADPIPELSTTAPAGGSLGSRFHFKSIAARLPEPVTWAMLILGFGAIGGVMRYQVRRSEARFTAKLRRIAAGETV